MRSNFRAVVDLDLFKGRDPSVDTIATIKHNEPGGPKSFSYATKPGGDGFRAGSSYKAGQNLGEHIATLNTAQKPYKISLNVGKPAKGTAPAKPPHPHVQAAMTANPQHSGEPEHDYHARLLTHIIKTNHDRDFAHTHFLPGFHPEGHAGKPWSSGKSQGAVGGSPSPTTGGATGAAAPSASPASPPASPTAPSPARPRISVKAPSTAPGAAPAAASASPRVAVKTGQAAPSMGKVQAAPEVAPEAAPEGGAPKKRATYVPPPEKPIDGDPEASNYPIMTAIERGAWPHQEVDKRTGKTVHAFHPKNAAELHTEVKGIVAKIIQDPTKGLKARFPDVTDNDFWDHLENVEGYAQAFNKIREHTGGKGSKVPLRNRVWTHLVGQGANGTGGVLTRAIDKYRNEQQEIDGAPVQLPKAGTQGPKENTARYKPNLDRKKLSMNGGMTARPVQHHPDPDTQRLAPSAGKQMTQEPMAEMGDGIGHYTALTGHNGKDPHAALMTLSHMAHSGLLGDAIQSNTREQAGKLNTTKRTSGGKPTEEVEVGKRKYLDVDTPEDDRTGLVHDHYQHTLLPQLAEAAHPSEPGKPVAPDVRRKRAEYIQRHSLVDPEEHREKVMEKFDAMRASGHAGALAIDPHAFYEARRLVEKHHGSQGIPFDHMISKHHHKQIEAMIEKSPPSKREAIRTALGATKQIQRGRKDSSAGRPGLPSSDDSIPTRTIPKYTQDDVSKLQSELAQHHAAMRDPTADETAKAAARAKYSQTQQKIRLANKMLAGAPGGASAAEIAREPDRIAAERQSRADAKAQAEKVMSDPARRALVTSSNDAPAASSAGKPGASAPEAAKGKAKGTKGAKVGKESTEKINKVGAQATVDTDALSALGATDEAPAKPTKARGKGKAKQEGQPAPEGLSLVAQISKLGEDKTPAKTPAAKVEEKPPAAKIEEKPAPASPPKAEAAPKGKGAKTTEKTPKGKKKEAAPAPTPPTPAEAKAEPKPDPKPATPKPKATEDTTTADNGGIEATRKRREELLAQNRAKLDAMPPVKPPRPRGGPESEAVTKDSPGKAPRPTVDVAKLDAEAPKTKEGKKAAEDPKRKLTRREKRAEARKKRVQEADTVKEDRTEVDPTEQKRKAASEAKTAEDVTPELDPKDAEHIEDDTADDRAPETPMARARRQFKEAKTHEDHPEHDVDVEFTPEDRPEHDVDVNFTPEEDVDLSTPPEEKAAREQAKKEKEAATEPRGEDWHAGRKAKATESDPFAEIGAKDADAGKSAPPAPHENGHLHDALAQRFADVKAGKADAPGAAEIKAMLEHVGGKHTPTDEYKKIGETAKHEFHEHNDGHVLQIDKKTGAKVDRFHPKSWASYYGQKHLGQQMGEAKQHVRPPKGLNVNYVGTKPGPIYNGKSQGRDYFQHKDGSVFAVHHDTKLNEVGRISPDAWEKTKHKHLPHMFEAPTLKEAMKAGHGEFESITPAAPQKAAPTAPASAAPPKVEPKASEDESFDPAKGFKPENSLKPTGHAEPKFQGFNVRIVDPKGTGHTQSFTEDHVKRLWKKVERHIGEGNDLTEDNILKLWNMDGRAHMKPFADKLLAEFRRAGALEAPPASAKGRVSAAEARVGATAVARPRGGAATPAEAPAPEAKEEVKKTPEIKKEPEAQSPAAKKAPKDKAEEKPNKLKGGPAGKIRVKKDDPLPGADPVIDREAASVRKSIAHRTSLEMAGEAIQKSIYTKSSEAREAEEKRPARINRSARQGVGRDGKKNYSYSEPSQAKTTIRPDAGHPDPEKFAMHLRTTTGVLAKIAKRYPDGPAFAARMRQKIPNLLKKHKVSDQYLSGVYAALQKRA